MARGSAADHLGEVTIIRNDSSERIKPDVWRWHPRDARKRKKGGLVHIIVDPPFSKRTHDGHNKTRGMGKRRGLPFSSWEPGDAYYAARRWSETLCGAEDGGWLVVMTDHVLMPEFERAMADAGRYVFAPIPFVASGSRVRLQGDGPTCWAIWLVISRPRSHRLSRWRSLPGAYVLPPGLPASERKARITGGKPLWLLKSLVRDYSNEGDLIIDPCAGSGTAGVAAMLAGRNALLYERRAHLCQHAAKWITETRESALTSNGQTA